MYNRNESIGIQPIHIRFVSNASPQNVLKLTRNMLYVPSKNNNDTRSNRNTKYDSEYPFFTDTVKLSENDFKKLNREELINTFFNSKEFKRFIQKTSNYNDKSSADDVRGEHADYNLNVMIRLLLSTSFPIHNNITDTFSENIKQESSDIQADNSSIVSYFSKLLKSKDNDFCYLNLNGSTYTLLSVTHVNDLINDKKFDIFIKTIIAFKLWYSQILQKLKKEKEDFNKKINDVLNQGTKDITNQNSQKSITKYINILNYFNTEKAKKDIETNNNRATRLAVSTIPLGILLSDIKTCSVNDFTKFLSLMTKISELNKFADKKSTAVGYIPYAISELDGFSLILSYTFDLAVNNQIHDLLQNKFDKIFNIITKKSKIEQESHLIEINAYEKIKNMKELPTFFDNMNKITPPSTRFSNTKLNELLSSYNTNKDILKSSLFNLIDLIIKLKIDEKPEDNVFNNNEIINLRSGVISNIESNSQNSKDKDKDNKTDVFGLDAKKNYDVFLKLELIKGILNSDNLDEIKCSYKNNKLINTYDDLKNKLDNINPVLLYIPNNLLDIEMLKKSNKKQQTPKKKSTYKNKIGGWKPKQQRRRTVKQRKNRKSKKNSIKQNSIDTNSIDTNQNRDDI